jgi:hypothetical protein
MKYVNKTTLLASALVISLIFNYTSNVKYNNLHHTYVSTVDTLSTYMEENVNLQEVIIEQSIEIGRYDIIMTRLHDEYPAVENKVLKNLE